MRLKQKFLKGGNVQKKSLPLSKVYRLLEPGPVVMLTTARGERANIMPMSWHTMIDFEPPLVGCIVSNQSHTFKTLKVTKECVINIPTIELAKQVVGCGNVSGRKVDKFKKFHLTPHAASRVNVPLIDECYANLECKVVDSKMATIYNLFVLKVVAAWIDPSKKNPKTLHHRGRDDFMVAGKTIKIATKVK